LGYPHGVGPGRGLTSTNQDQDEAEAMRPLWIVRVDPLQKSLQRVIAGGAISWTRRRVDVVRVTPQNLGGASH